MEYKFYHSLTNTQPPYSGTNKLGSVSPGKGEFT